MSPIPPFDLTQQYTTISEEVSAAVLDVLSSGQYIKGSVVESFERQFANYIGTSEGIACNSGTDALYLALRALQIGAGDEVITSPFTFIATAEVISAVGATPVFVDVEPETFNLDLKLIEAAITERTRAIIPVHLFGQPVNMTRLMAIAQTHRLVVIEDCAQAIGAKWGNARVGSIGHIGCFSFYPTKNLGACGDGGAVTTNDSAIAAAIRMLGDHGRKSGYFHEKVGVNSRLDAVQAAILQIKLRYLDSWNDQRQTVAKRYHQLLHSISDLVVPQIPEGGHGVWNQYTIRLSRALETHQHNGHGNFRDAVRQQLQQQGVSSMVYYPLPLHLQPVYADLGYQVGQLPVSEQLAKEVLSLPMFPELSALQQEQVVYTLKDSLLQVAELSV
ncbi:DegT/DnrJ/EryC1/StrS family aminotransferase [Oculatella sp. LEGE 06141]|uniref:aminotransferase class I/II-fold pyridoxal phosphate-dependent enzyme n=1 Tax=Oculatella sp. LEGE 06141 TaxID=1828648 RepID=UPI001881CDD2|nr:DegT/DnrJ/EryC1/StrS family aminotransferase [Oculatella sp. LEGE 06141]